MSIDEDWNRPRPPRLTDSFAYEEARTCLIRGDVEDALFWLGRAMGDFDRVFIGLNNTARKFYSAEKAK